MLKGKVAVVTRSTHGTGLGIACRLAAGGVDLAINGSDDSTAAEMLRDDISNTYGIRVAFSSADVSEPFGSEMLINDVNDMLGRVDILINNVGIQPAAEDEFPVEQWNSTIGKNLTAVFFTTRAVLPQMFERDWGRIINVASMHGPVAATTRAAYVATAHGVVGLTKFIAMETAASGITCNAICPDLLIVNRLEKLTGAIAALDQIELAEADVRLPYERSQPPEPCRDRLGHLTRFLCSDAAACLNGVTLPVDDRWFPQ